MWNFWGKNKEQVEPTRNEKEPWVRVVGENIDPVKGIQIELDWNDAFVVYLRNNGYTGSSDEAIVQKWLAHLYKHLMEEMNPTQKSTFE